MFIHYVKFFRARLKLTFALSLQDLTDVGYAQILIDDVLFQLYLPSKLEVHFASYHASL